MGNILTSSSSEADPDSAWKVQNREMATNPMYKFADLAKGGELIKAYEDQGPDRVKEIAKTKMMTYLYNCGKGAVIEKSEYIKWCNNRKAKFKAFVSGQKFFMEPPFISLYSISLNI